MSAEMLENSRPAVIDRRYGSNLETPLRGVPTIYRNARADSNTMYPRMKIPNPVKTRVSRPKPAL